MEIVFMEIDGEVVSFYFKDDPNWSPFVAHEFKKGSTTRKRLERLERRINRWNDRNPVAIRTISMTSAGAVFHRAVSVGSFTDVNEILHGPYFQGRLDRMERILRRWNKKNKDY